jgi:hypothetical protein
MPMRDTGNILASSVPDGYLAICTRLLSGTPRFAGRASTACGDFPVDSLQEGLDHRVAVFGAKLRVRRSGGADLLWGKR